MTVSTEVDHNDYIGNGVTTSFPYTFRIFHKSDLVVQVVDLSENITELTLDTDYMVTGAGGYTGGNVVLTSPLANGYQMSISRELPVTQETDLRNQGKFFAEVHEDAFDKLTMLIQQVRSWLSLALRKPSFVSNYYDALGNYIRNLRDPSRPQDAATKNYVDSLASGNYSRTLRTPEPIPQLPGIEQRKNKLVAMNDSGDPIMVLPESGSASDVMIELAKPTGAGNIGVSGGGTVQDSLNKISDFMINADASYYSTRNISKLSYVDYQVHTRGSIKVCFQGDSMTAGFDQTSSDIVPPDHGDYATHASMTYPQRFTDFLSQQSGCVVVPTWRAYSGFTAKMAYEKPDWQSNPNVDVFVLMYGLNDIGLSTIDEYLDYMQRLIRRFINWGSGVVVCIPSNGGQGSRGALASIWARRMKMVAQAYGCAVFDANEVSYNRHDGAIQSDAGHFNSMGYAIHGEKLASMFMAGGILPTYTPVTNEITTWPGRVDNSIGYCDAKSNISLGRSDGAFTRTKIVGSLPAFQAALMTFSFYLDSDAAHIFVKGSGPLNIIMHNGIWWNNNAQDYYSWALSQDVSFAMQTQAQGTTGYNDLPGEFPSYKAERKFIGRIMGKGWHTITIFNAQDAGTATDGYVNAVTIQPVPIGYSIQKYNWKEEKRILSVQSLKMPSPYGQATVPPAVALSSFYMKAPQALMPTNTSVASLNDITPYSFNSGHAFLKISNSSGDYIESLIIKTTSGNYNFQCKIIASTLDSAARPTITASLKKRSTKLYKAAGANGTNQPIESIYDSDGAYADPNAAASAAGGLYLLFTITWPGAAPTSYWNIDVESSDLFGSSEVFVGR